MGGEQEDNQRVSFTVKELLGQINSKLDTMAIAIAAKADHAEMQRLAARVETLERAGIAQKSITRYKRWLLGSGIALVAAIATLAALAVKLKP